MDVKVFRMALLTIISAIILVFVIVYATNADKINGLFGKGNDKSGNPATAASYMSGDGVMAGEQIGDDLNAFMYDEEFFDELESIPAVVVIKKNSSGSDGSSDASSDASSEDQDGTGMAVQGQLYNPNGAGEFTSANSSGADVPPGGDVPGKEPTGTLPGTSVGTPPSGN
ncbi:hypothetical protein [Butyrivibrio proteoclasticus]|uniref:hypothetical protein n=1 Tax=Butyrivibrio proteoclasticus TaxID=43305 RepID=UPI00047B3BF0|nr:hypothetical protein [Butyrivibrio proteoclasticus]